MMFPVGALPNAFRLETRKALVVIDLQNDFLREDGKLFVRNVGEFLPHLPSLVAKFREKGDVFWAHTEFLETRPNVCPELGSYVIVLEDSLATARSSEVIPPGQTEQPEDDIKHTPQERGSDDPEAFLARRSTATWPRCCLPDTFGCAPPKTIASLVDHGRDSTVVKSSYSAFQTESLLPTLRMKLITQLYLCGSLSNISIYATALDAVRHGLEVTVIEDCVGYRNERCHEEAMRQMADAMGVNGTDYQELMDDLSGNLGEVVTASTFKSTVGTRGMGEDTGADGYTMRVRVKRWMDDLNSGTQADGAHGIEQETDGFEAASVKRRSLSNRAGLSMSSAAQQETRPSPVVAAQKRSSDKIDHEDPANTLSHPSSNAKTSRVRMRRSSHVASSEPPNAKSATAVIHAAVDAAINATTFDEAVVGGHHSEKFQQRYSVGIIEAAADPNRSLLDEMSALVDKGRLITRSLRGGKRSKKRTGQTFGPGDFLGERDSRIIYDFLPASDLFNDAFARLRADGASSEVRWQTMYHRSGKVPRLVAVQGEVSLDGSIPIYRHPADEAPPLLPFSPTVQSIREEVEKVIGHPVNHVLIQLYRGGEDSISEHSDKTLDIVRGSFVVNVSLGAMRTMILRRKKSASAARGPGQLRRASVPTLDSESNAGLERVAQRIPLPHNSLFVLGQNTNQIWLHAIQADKRPASEKTTEELAFDGQRISLTFRHIGTFINPTKGTIWGQGATSKRFEGAGHVLEGEEAEKEGERLIRAFGQENHQSYGFEWQAQYGAGFDVVNFTTKDDAGS